MNIQAILSLDADLTRRLRVAEQPGVLRTLAAFLGRSGDSWFWLAGLLAVWIWANSEEWKSWALHIILSILATAVVVMTLKFTIRRARPEGEWGQGYRKVDPHSFPSGHAARGVLIGLLVLGLGVGPAWLGWLLFVWGPLVGLARVAMGVHYLSDIAAGWVIGAAMAGAALQFA